MSSFSFLSISISFSRFLTLIFHFFTSCEFTFILDIEACTMLCCCIWLPISSLRSSTFPYSINSLQQGLWCSCNFSRQTLCLLLQVDFFWSVCMCSISSVPFVRASCLHGCLVIMLFSSFSVFEREGFRLWQFLKFHHVQLISRKKYVNAISRKYIRTLGGALRGSSVQHNILPK